MKSLNAFEQAYGQLLLEIAALKANNDALAAALEAKRTEARRLSRSLKDREARHAARLQEWKVRAHEYREKMSAYQRDLAALRSITRNHKHE